MKRPPGSSAFLEKTPFLLPAIDLRGGRVVRLIRGEAAAEIDYQAAPLSQARRWIGEGAEGLHLVDLGGAFGEPDSAAAILEIAGAVAVPVQAGGGIRDAGKVRELLDGGVARVLLGTRVLQDPEFLKAQVAEHGPERIVLAMDLAQGRVRISGWTEDSSLDLRAGMELAVKAGARHLLVTAIDRDGTLSGPDLPLLEEALRLAGREGLRVVSAGGIGKLQDLESVVKLGSPALEGVVVGRALYEGTLALREAVSWIRNYRQQVQKRGTP
ncbi:MAG: 1-(5-phosphoribosyl)-5-[(5-phosphoribosylamino)methylideneamino] imidazole-4-carboxamide isomerase [Planctomycetes bacterium]|nr:1-(5-phosphoribosyl)-5-[(5-phosphoribosylamino)methylideneamino] imidazole-4-carboxamide isomerase [Planctomycetota bacterium]